MKLRSKDLKPGMVVRPYNTPSCGYWGEVVRVKQPKKRNRWDYPYRPHRGGTAARGCYWTVYVHYASGETLARVMHTNRWWEVQEQ